MVMIVERDIPIERTDKGEDHLCLSLAYREGEGYYLSCYPVARIVRKKVTNGLLTSYNVTSGSGIKVLVRKAKHSTPYAEKEAISRARDSSDWLIAMACNKYNLRRI